MKKLLLILTAIIGSIIVQGQTSVYHPFPDSNAVWNYRFQMNCFANGNADETYSIMLTSDTLINNVTYRKLTIPYVQSMSTGTCGGYTSGYKGAIRQDSSTKTVYIVPPSNNTEQLLYDFTLQVGDTVSGYIENSIGSLDTVQSIDSILVGNTYRKRWEINNCYGIYLIEGIGSTYGLIEPSPGCVTDLADYSLTCFNQENQTLLPDTNTSCLLISSLYSLKKPIIDVSFYPNPFANQTTIKTNKNLKNASLIIKNYQGQTVLLLENINGKTVMLNRNGLSTGIYLVSLTQNKELIGTYRLVVTTD